MGATLQVFCAGAVKPAILEFVPPFERATGRALQFTFGPVGSLQARVLAGEPADVLILARPALEQLSSRGKMLPETLVDLGRVGIGIAVRRAAATPDIATPEALRQTLLAAKSLAYGDPAKGDSSGIHFAKVLEELGIAREVRAKAVLAPLGLAVAALVDDGEVEMGVTQASVIVARKGIKLAGLLPAGLQHTTTYSAAVAADAAAAEAAKNFVHFLSTPLARLSFAAAGFAP